ncbi:MAG: hypothetical protein ACPW60_10835 [Methylohalobius sp. ZOD2]|nr:hypothetical protein [Methylothermaceae bacterium]
MKNIQTVSLLAAFISVLALDKTAHAAGETEYILTKTLTSLTPVFLSGHEGDPNFISGFAFTGDVQFNGADIGNLSGDVTLVNPPLNLNDTYAHGVVRIANTISGFGTFEVTGNAVSVSSSTSATAGDILFSWSGTIHNGTGQLEDSFGISAGAAQGNIFTGTGDITEVIQLRQGF